MGLLLMEEMSGAFESDDLETTREVFVFHGEFVEPRIDAAIIGTGEGEGRYFDWGLKKFESFSRAFGGAAQHRAVVAKSCAFDARLGETAFQVREFLRWSLPVRGPVSPEFFDEGPIACFDRDVGDSSQLEEKHVPGFEELAGNFWDAFALHAIWMRYSQSGDGVEAVWRQGGGGVGDNAPPVMSDQVDGLGPEFVDPRDKVLGHSNHGVVAIVRLR